MHTVMLHKSSTLSRCSSSQQPQSSQHHQREAPDLTEELIRILQTKMAYLIPLLPATGIIANKLQGSLELLDLLPALCIF